MAHWNIAFITGGGSGIGRRIAEVLLREGSSVAIFDRSNNPEVVAELEAIAAQLPGVSCRFYQADVTDAAGLSEAVLAAIQEVGTPDFALNCAGIQIAKTFEELTAAEFETVVGVNLFGSRNFAAAVLPHMTRGGQFSLIASLAGLVTSYSYSAYNASKHGVVGLAGALRLEYIEKGVEVSVICPPEINTPMVVEERKMLAPAGAKLKDAAGTLELEPACEYILAHIKRRQYMIIPGFRARCITVVARFFPGIMRKFSERTVITTLREKSA